MKMWKDNDLCKHKHFNRNPKAFSYKKLNLGGMEFYHSKDLLIVEVKSVYLIGLFLII